MSITDRDWLIALHQVEGVGWQIIQHLCQRVESLSELADWPASALKELRIPAKVRLRIKEQMEAERVAQVKEEIHKADYSVVTILDQVYPSLLREIPRPPWVLYAKGNLELLRYPAIAMVGSRRPTSYGRMVAHRLSRELAQRQCCVVSGMARGIDTESHLGALSAPGPTIAVLGSAIDKIYPPENARLYQQLAEEGLIISEYPPGTRGHPGLFPQRNRIISGLSLGTVVVEAGARSGALITADLALEQSREVFAVPGPIFSPQSIGTNQLIAQGAKMVLNVESILEEFPMLTETAAAREENAVPVTREEQRLLEVLGYTTMHLDELIKNAGMKPGELYPLLLSLQMKGLVRQLPGSYFVRMEPNSV